jgi:Holliday junction resolvase
MINNYLRITPVTKDCRVEFSYLYVWNEPYEVVDARYFIFGLNKEKTIRNLKLFVYKLWYINPDICSNEVCEYVVNIVKKKSSTGIYITESEVYKLVYSIFESNLPSNISSIVKTKDGVTKVTKIVEWKNNLNGLLVVDSKRITEIRKCKDINKEVTKEYKKIKLKYMKNCIDRVGKDNKLQVIETTIDSLREDKESATIKDISDLSGIGYLTTRKYIDLMADRLDFIDGFKVIRNQHKETSDNTISDLIKCKEELISNGIKLNKMSLHKASGISRPTIDKHWSIIKNK